MQFWNTLHTGVHRDARDLTESSNTKPTANLAGASTIVRDIIEEKRREPALRMPEDHYRLLFEGNPIPMWVFDRGTLRFLAVNEAAIRQYGYTRQEFLAKTILEIRPEEDLADVLADLADRHPGLQERGFWRHRRKNGELIDVEIVCHPLDFQGTESILVSAYNITARKRAEEAIRQAEEKYRGMFEDAVIGIFQATLDGRVVGANRAFAQIHGFDSPEQLLTETEGKTLAVDPGKMAKCAQIVAEQGALCGIEMEVYTRNRSRKWIRLSVRDVRDDAGRAVLCEGTAEDITEQKRSEEMLQSAENKYRALFEDTAEASWLADENGILECNSAALQMFGYTAGEVMPHPAEMSPPIQPDGTPSHLAAEQKTVAAIRDGKVHFEWMNLRKNGDSFPTDVAITTLTISGKPHLFFSARDITERKHAEEMLEDSKNRYRVLFEDSGDASWVMDEKGFVDCNPAALRMFGYSTGTLMLHPADISPPNQPDGTNSRIAAQQKMASAFLNGKERFEWMHQRENGEVFPAEVCLSALTLSGRPMLLATVRDITERKLAEEALLFKTALLEAQAETTIDGILVVDESDRIVLANKQFGLGFGVPDELMSTQDDLIVRKYVSERVEAPDAFLEEIKYLNSNRHEKSTDELRLKNGMTFDRYSAPLVDSKKQYRGRIWYFRDITERKAAEERIQFLAYYDALTELPHRAILEDRLEHALGDARRRGEKIALLFVDIDQFKAINDSFGHSFGDILLRDVAKRLRACGQEQDTLARVGGDEFVVLLSSAKGAADAATAAYRIMEALNENFVIQGQSLNVSCSVGVSMFPEHGTDSEALIRNADAAMYCAKSHGRNKVWFFNNEMNAEAQERLAMDKNLRLALDREEFFLVYQPQVEIETGRITGFEALIRWQHPELGLVRPDRFIPIAENNGLIVPIGEWVLRAACAQARKWQEDGLVAVPVAVNVSAVQFRQEGFTALIRSVLAETRLSAKYLELELTESLLLSNVEMVSETLRDLKEMGLQLAIDDFGTGYSSLSYLKRLPFDKLKIDRSFIRDIAVDPDDAAITTAIISMAKNLHLRVIAEGVETEDQMSFLQGHMCDEIQGYYFGKPVLADETASMLSDHIYPVHRKIPRHSDGLPFPRASSFGSIPVST